MLFGYILLLIALTISAVAAFYSIAGLTAIFAAAKMSNNQAVQIVYTCIDGTSANCHAALNYA